MAISLHCPGTHPPCGRGFTLLELLVVLVIVALASTGVALALRDQSADILEREAQRLIAQLEAARAESRANGQAWFWRPATGGFELRSARTDAPVRPPEDAAQTWLDGQTQSRIAFPPNAPWLVLGPEPLIPAQSVTLQHGAHALTIGTNGFKAFAVLDTQASSEERARP